MENDHKQKEAQAKTPEDRILEAALEIIQEKTIGGLRIRQVADRAHMFQSNIHYYYGSKNELLLAVQKKVLSRYQEIRNQYWNASGEKASSLEDYLDIFIRQKAITILEEEKYDIAELDFWNQSRLEPEMHQEFCHSYENWRQEIRTMLHQFVPQMSCEKQSLLSAVTVSLLEGATIQYLADKQAFDLPAYFRYCKEILMKEMKG